MKKLVTRYNAAINDYERYATLFNQFVASAVTYAVNLDESVGGRCTSESLEKILAKINYVVSNLIPIFSTLIETYANAKNLY